MKRTQWNENRNGEMYCMTADEIETGFEFAERSTWDVQWYRLPPTNDLIAKAYFAKAMGIPVLYEHVCLDRRRVDQSIVRVRLAEQMNKPSRDAADSKYPWGSGSFYLFAFVLIVCLGVAAETMVHHIAILPLILSFGLLSICFIGVLQLKQDKRIGDGNFLKIMLQSLRSLFPFKKRQS